MDTETSSIETNHSHALILMRLRSKQTFYDLKKTKRAESFKSQNQEELIKKLQNLNWIYLTTKAYSNNTIQKCVRCSFCGHVFRIKKLKNHFLTKHEKWITEFFKYKDDLQSSHSTFFPRPTKQATMEEWLKS